MKELQERLRNIILNTCNKIGCKDCGLKWGGGCSATELQNSIDSLEFDKSIEFQDVTHDRS